MDRCTALSGRIKLTFPTYDSSPFQRAQSLLPHTPKETVHVNRNFLSERSRGGGRGKKGGSEGESGAGEYESGRM